MSLVVALVGVVCASGANWYVRDTASGAGTGVNWTDAFTSVAAAESACARGDTIYVADGAYPGVTFNVPTSGTTPITVQKATVASHGTDIGWLDSYGDGQAVFPVLHIRFFTDYWVFDGQARGTNWFDPTTYGFRVDRDPSIVDTNFNNAALGVIKFGDLSVSSANNITVRYTAVLSRTNFPLPGVSYGAYCFASEAPISTNITISHCYARGSSNPLFIRATKNTLIEYTAVEGAIGNGSNHGLVVNGYYSVSEAIIRYNQFRSNYVAGGGTAIIGLDPTPFQAESWSSQGWLIYGNVFDTFLTGSASIGFIDSRSSNNRVYQNTIVNALSRSGVELGTGTNNIVQNNLWINAGVCNFNGVSRNYNAYGGSIASGNYDNGSEANIQLGLTTAIFTDFATADFTLASDTDPGNNLGAPYNVDLTGALRTTWSRGAYQFLTTTPSAGGIFLGGKLTLRGVILLHTR